MCGNSRSLDGMDEIGDEVAEVYTSWNSIYKKIE